MEAGKLYFFTATILDWQQLLKPNSCKQIIIDCWQHFIDRHKLKIYAFVIMPNHYHVVWSIHHSKPEDIQRDIHKWTARQLISWLNANDVDRLNWLQVDAADRIIQIWQRNPLPIELYSDTVIWQKIDYIHNNPCTERWNLVQYPEQYLYSSAKFYLMNEKNWEFLTHIAEV